MTPTRCPWATTDDLIRYHDEEWGRPVHGDRALFERLTLEAFQSGLSWLTILRRRDGFRAAFREFDIDTVAAFSAADRERLMADAGIIRNARKVDAAIGNARVLAAWRVAEGDGVLDRLIWSGFEDAPRPRTMSDVRSTSPQSQAIARELKSRGFTFVGPTTVHAMLQACGVVDEHLADCWVPMRSARG